MIRDACTQGRSLTVKLFPQEINNLYRPNVKLVREQGLYFGNDPELTKKKEILLKFLLLK